MDSTVGDNLQVIPSKTSQTQTIFPHDLIVTEPKSERSVSSTEENHPPDTWLLNGPLGSKNSLLVFKSSELANSSELAIRVKPAYKLHVTYKVLQAETRLLSKILDCHGVTEVPPNSSDFNLLWTGSHPKPGTFRTLAPHQRLNHFPRAYELTRKDRLYKNIEMMQHQKGYKNFDFIPQTFVMPLEYRELCTTHNRIKGPWIVKPVASSRGRGIFIVETPNQVPLEEPVVVAKYLSKPLLVAGHKCDLRLYIVVTSFDPLIIYIYEEGLVRFATVKYDSSHKQLWNPCMHLCNYSINKYHSDYVRSDDPSAENVGHKWTLSALLRHLKSEGRDTISLMSQIEDLVIKAILASANSIISACNMFVPHLNNCFELFGFDILIDDSLKPWLLEVNLSPSLNCESPLDVRLKSAMLADLLTMVGIPAIDPVLRPVSTKTSIGKMKQPNNCRRSCSADGFSNTFPKKSSISPTNQAPPNGEEMKIVKAAKEQFERRGGFVRIFPAIDSWDKYSKYLDTSTGIPLTIQSSSVYSLTVNHNYNLLLFTQLFPNVFISVNTKMQDKILKRSRFGLNTKREMSLDRLAVDKSVNGRQDRYERTLSQGHKSILHPRKIVKEPESIELRKKIVDLLQSGKKISQFESRKTFSHYLVFVLKRIVAGPNQEDHIDIVIKFLQKASNYVRTPFSVKMPCNKLDFKDRTAITAKQLNDFLYLYNRETDLFVDKKEKPNQIPSSLYSEFLEHARECDLEEVLMYQTTQTVPTYGVKPGLPSVLKTMPNKPMGPKLSGNKSAGKGRGSRVSPLL
ncbi:unnamed protein product [Brassicogethes aeneus]|uniref:Tubulin--tyrosine ligase-like protein 5 n=1 Tax=Brassicogethes aeneus TaxID=1431903 RepID=A0A9P0AWA3_BRAAE|nr:unnamed protein product [Brassicogethes aeneus]